MKSKDTLKSILEWQQRACPNPDAKAKSVGLGIHLEEVAEMFPAMGFPHSNWYIDGLALDFKNHESYIQKELERTNRKELADSLCDQIVTAIGVAHRFNIDILGALAEVNRSNWSKLVDGKFQYDKNGKVIKPDTYSPPNLEEFIQ